MTDNTPSHLPAGADLPALTDELRAAVADALDSSVPAGSGARSVGRSLGLTTTVGWKLWTIGSSDDRARVLEAIPGERGWRTMLAALEAHCPSRSKVERVRVAMVAVRAVVGNAPAIAARGAAHAVGLNAAGAAVTVRPATSYELVMAGADQPDAVIPLRAERAVIDYVLPRSAADPQAEVRMPPSGGSVAGGWRNWTPIQARIIATALANLADPAAAAPHNALLEHGLSAAGMDARSCLVMRYCVEGPPPGAALVLARNTAR